MYRNRHVTVIIPALNEEPSIAKVIDGLFSLQACNHCAQLINDESSQAEEANPLNTLCCSNSSTDCNGSATSLVDTIIVGDNGSTDETATISRACGAMVMDAPERGYGAACLAALAAPVEKDIIVFVDGDHSVTPNELPSLLNPIMDGADLVIGSRTLGECEKGALSIPQSLGNTLAIVFMRLMWGGKITDLGPFRAITQQALSAIDMRDKKFGWTVEMQIRAMQLSLITVEVPVSTKVRIGKSKISGTVKGVIAAGHGILGTIGKLYWRQITGSHKVVSDASSTKPSGHIPS